MKAKTKFQTHGLERVSQVCYHYNATLINRSIDRSINQSINQFVPSPPCIGKCGRPAELNHGLFVMSSAGDAVSYVCDQGYDLLGDRDHKCENGEWVGEQPVCAGKDLHRFSLA